MSEFPTGSVAFVTGAASGIGLEVSRRLVADGIRKIAIVDLNVERLKETAAILSAIDESTQVLGVGCDCSSEDAVNSAVADTVKEFGRLDFCFNGAGIGVLGGPIAEVESAALDATLGVNLRGVWLCERAEIRQMMKQEMRDVSTGLKLKTRGSIVNAGSLTSHQAISQLTPYIMSKHAVLGLTRADALDYGAKGIRINCVCPGWIRTNMTEELATSPIGETLIARAPMNRWGMPEEIAYTVAFLLSDRASFMTGASVAIDGGYSAC